VASNCGDIRRRTVDAGQRGGHERGAQTELKLKGEHDRRGGGARGPAKAPTAAGESAGGGREGSSPSTGDSGGGGDSRLLMLLWLLLSLSLMALSTPPAVRSRDHLTMDGPNAPATRKLGALPFSTCHACLKRSKPARVERSTAKVGERALKDPPQQY